MHRTTIRRSQRIVVVGVVVLMASAAPTHAYQLAQRWQNTATSGNTGTFGSPVTLTWSFALDGTLVDPSLANPTSDLIEFLDSSYGGGTGDLRARPWFAFFESVFDRWSELSGLTYVYEPNDDGELLTGSVGQLGVRGDVRLAGTFLDGNGLVLGYNTLPQQGGDMVLDTGQTLRFSDPTDNYLGFRSVIAHEHGHGLGLQHVFSNDSLFLMGPEVLTTFDGPQLDDIRGLHRGYGDVLEKSNGGAGNNNSGNSTPLGVLPHQQVITIGSDGGNDTVVDVSAVDFVSIDDNSDIDFYSFEVPVASLVDVLLTPVGPAYFEGATPQSQRLVRSDEISDLTLTLIDGDGFTVLANANRGGLGTSELLTGMELDAGEYFLRISGNANDVQLYQLEATATFVPEPAGALWIWGCVGLVFARCRR